MIKATKSEWLKKAFYLFESKVIFPRKFKKIIIDEVPVKADHSVLLLQNHFSWWDGFWGSYLAYKFLHRSYHVMVQESQLEKHLYFKYRGAFSIKKKSKELFKSIEYTNELLANPKNMVLIFPQGKLQSLYTDEIILEKGVQKLLEKAPDKCQVIYNAVTVNYFEGFKPTIQFHLLDCGLARNLNTEILQDKLSAFQQEMMQKTIRK